MTDIFICPHAGAIELCRKCYHSKPHKWNEMHGCGNNTSSICIERIKEENKSIGATAAGCYFRCVECRNNEEEMEL